MPLPEADRRILRSAIVPLTALVVLSAIGVADSTSAGGAAVAVGLGLLAALVASAIVRAFRRARPAKHSVPAELGWRPILGGWIGISLVWAFGSRMATVASALVLLGAAVALMTFPFIALIVMRGSRGDGSSDGLG